MPRSLFPAEEKAITHQFIPSLFLAFHSHSNFGNRVMMPCLMSTGVNSILLLDANTAKFPIGHHENQFMDKFIDLIDFSCFFSTFIV